MITCRNSYSERTKSSLLIFVIFHYFCGLSEGARIVVLTIGYKFYFIKVNSVFSLYVAFSDS
jgi:hypothetical protein